GAKILDNIHCTVSPGQWLQVSGKSGTGKSTLLRLLTGAYKNFEGSILIDGQPIGSYHLESLRRLTGIFLSSQDIFQGTLWENIVIGNELATIDAITEYAAKIGLADFIHLHKNGMDRQLDAMGKKLPKHIRQKILLLRSLIGKPRLLLLEEPFKYLTPSEIESTVSFLKNKQHTTVLIATESKTLLTGCDMILSLEKEG
ncbi:MAG: ATP-binding cassette domain-containing protein, partial [Sediminibacterium sp.]